MKLTPYHIRERVRNTGPGGSTVSEFQMDYKDPVTGKRKRPTLEARKLSHAKQEAERIYYERKEEARKLGLVKDTGHIPGQGSDAITLKDLLEKHYARLNIEESTRQTEEFQTANILRFATHRALASDLDAGWVDRYVAWRRSVPAPSRSKPATDATILKELKLIAQAQRWGYDRRYCSLPNWKIPRLSPIKKKPRCLTEPELQKLLHAIGSDENPLRQLVEVYYLTGLRRSELLNLKWEAIDWASSKLRLVTKKGGTAGDRREDVVFLPPRAIKLLRMREKAIAEESGASISPADYIFAEARFQSIKNRSSVNSLNKVLKRYAKAAGIRNPDQVGVHTLRHTCATHLLKAKATVPEAAAHLRHRDGGALLLRTYAHAHEDELRAATKLLSKVATKNPVTKMAQKSSRSSATKAKPVARKK